MERIEVGNPLNFRGLIYSPINEQGVVYLFGLIAEDLNIRVESIQQGYPDCTGIRYIGKGRWERIRIEFEYKSGNFDHDPKGCDMIVCWEDNLNDNEKKDMGIDILEIIELKSRIKTPEVPNKELEEPDVLTSEKAEFDLQYHFQRNKVNKNIQELFEKLHNSIMNINPDIWDKYSKTAITYYSPERMFVFLKFRKSKIRLTIFTNWEDIHKVKNVKNHENWGNFSINSEIDLSWCMDSIKKSYEIMKKAIKENINTGWFAKTPKEKLGEELEEGYTEDEEEDEKLVEHYEKLDLKEKLFNLKNQNL